MAFLNPILLFAMVAAGVPLAIHLLGRRRPRTVQFSAMAFLHQLRREQFRRLRLRHWLLLLLRTLTIVLLVLAFARPALRAAFGSAGYRGTSTMVFVVDDGPSMSYQTPNGSRLSIVRDRIASLLPSVGQADHAMVIRTSRPDLVVPLDGRTLTSLGQASRWSGNGVSALRHAASLLAESRSGNRELYVASDFAGPPWNDIEAIDWPARTHGFALTPSDEATRNLSVASISFAGELVRAGQALELAATVHSTGSTTADHTVVALWLDGRRVQQRTISVEPGATAAVRFSARIPRAGWTEGYVELESDPLAADNRRSFALDVPSTTRLLIVGRECRSRSYLATIFSSPGTGSPYAVDIAEPELLSREAVERADVILLNEHLDIPDRAVGWIGTAARTGTGIVTLLGPESDLQAANRRILPLSGDARVTGLRLAAGRGSNQRSPGSSDAPSYFALAPPWSNADGIGTLLEAAGSDLPRFANYVVARHGSDDAVRFGNGDPWLIVSGDSTGRGAIVTAGLDPEWTDLPLRGVVVPIMHRLASRVAAPVPLQPDYHAGQRVERTIPASHGAARVDVETPDGTLHPVAGTGSRDGYAVDVGTVDSPGIWRIRAGGRVADVFAVNVDRSESDLDRITVEDFALAAGIPSITELGPNPAAEVAATRRGTELDVASLIVALACIAAEVILMRGVRAPLAPSAARVA